MRWNLFGRVVAIVLVALLGYATVSFFAAYRRWARWVELLDKIPLRLAVDLSTPGVYRGVYEQYCVPPAGLMLYVEPVGEGASGDREEKSLSGLVGTIRLLDDGGEEVLSHSLDVEGSGMAWSGEPEGWLYRFRVHDAPFGRGKYRVELEVEKGADGLAGVEHEMVGRYDISLIPMGRDFYLVLSVLSFLGAAGVGCVWLVLVVRGRKRVAQMRGLRGQCVGCGYDLTGNTSGVCPECGLEIGGSETGKDGG